MPVVEQWAGFTSAVLDERYFREARLNEAKGFLVLASPPLSLLFVSLCSAEACRPLKLLVHRVHVLALH